MRLNELTLDELAALGSQIATLVTAGRALESGRLGPVFDLTPGAPITIYTNAVMPGVPVDQVIRQVYDGSLKPVILADIPSFLRQKSTEAPPAATDAEPVDPPPALGEVAGGGTDSAEPSRPAEADAVPQDAAEAGAEAESGGGADVAASEAPAAVDADVRPEKWTATEDAVLIQLIVQGIMDKGLGRKAAIMAAARSIGRPAPGTIWRVANRLNDRLGAALTESALGRAQTETSEIPATETEGKAVVSEDAAAGGHSPAAVQELSPATLDQVFDKQVDAMPDLHGEDLRVWQWVAAHRARWPHTAGTDLDLAVGLGRGEKLNLISHDLGIDIQKLQERWDCLSRPIRNAQDKITIDGMPRLINILRRIAKAPAAAA